MDKVNKALMTQMVKKMNDDVVRNSPPNPPGIGELDTFKKWLNSIPVEPVRNDCGGEFQTGLNIALISKNPELELSVGNIASLQNWMGGWNDWLKKNRADIIQALGYVMRVDSNNKITRDTSSLGQIIKDHGWLIATHLKVKEYLDQVKDSSDPPLLTPTPEPGPIPVPFNPSGQPSQPVPKPSFGDPKQEAHDDFWKTYKILQLETKGLAYDSVVIWISTTVMSAIQRIDQYKAIKPQTAEMKYYLGYFKELLSICQSEC